MFGDVALHLLKLMGCRETVPGALYAEDVPAALQRLEAAVKADGESPESEQSTVEEDDETAVGLSQRALPLIEMLKASVKEECNVMWKSGS
jgi:hypothetical protein